MDETELLIAQIQNEIDLMEVDYNQRIEATKEIYSEKSNFEPHSQPDQENYYYPQNPKIVFTGEGA